MKIPTLVALVSLSVTGWTGSVSAEELGRAGTFVAVQGTVTMQPATLTAPRAVRPYDDIGPLAIVETKSDSRAKILFDDDTLIAIGANSRLEMTEQTYSPGSENRAFVAHLMRGKVRVLAGRRFPGDNSVFEVHSRTAVATARGTYFLMWIEEAPSPSPAKDQKRGSRPLPPEDLGSDYEGATGLANIGHSGDVAFTSGGATVLVLPGQSTIALAGSPPSMPVSTDSSAGPLASLLAGTALADVPRTESPRAALASVGMGGGTWSQSPVAGTAPSGALGGQFASGGYAIPGWPLPVTPVTPPAVVSGAAESSIRFTIRLP